THYNSELRWEQVGMTNIAIDFRAAGNRITGSIDFFFKNGKNLFGPAILDYTGGVGSTIIKNVANMAGRGMDIGFQSINVDNGRLNWSTNLNFTTIKDKVTDYHISNTNGNNFVNTTSNMRISGIEGRPVYAVYSYRWAGLDPKTGEPRGYINGEISTDYTQLTESATQLDDLEIGRAHV